SAVTYPMMIVGMMLIVILVLVIKVLPIFNDVFKQLGTEMTGFSKGMLNFGTAVSRYALVIVIVAAVLIAAVFILTKTAAGRAKLRSFLSKFVATRGLYDKIAAGRFASGMALTMSAGLDTDESLAMVSNLVDNSDMIEKINKSKEFMAEGKSFADALSMSGIFYNMYSRMISVGFRTGSVDKVLEKIAVGYDEEVDEKMSNLISVLEPTLVIILSVVVCLILLSVMLPLMGVMGSIG
ncbi:MAG: type II secretion system F family protein, partial [Ruminococcus sp.]|nr:type II secretion system F family protein [Ruminococcus sp.]